MAGSVNKVILVGNVGQDPEVRQFQNGGQVASFSPGDVGKLERSQYRRAQGKDRMASDFGVQ